MKLNYYPYSSSLITTSGASRKKRVMNFSKCIIIKHKKLFQYNAWRSGRGSSGQRITLSKGRKLLKSRVSRLNRFYRDNSISFIGGFAMNPYSKTLSSIVFSGSGSTSALPSTDYHKVLKLTYLKSLFYKRSTLYNSILMTNANLNINPGFHLIIQLPRHCPVSNLEVSPGLGSSISRSSGTYSKLIKIDPRTSLSLVKLPSGVKKVISVFSIGSIGKSALSDNSKLNNTSSFKDTSRGNAPRSRGVAKNPVDHPHGGRTKAIKYPRTPWGTTTKYK